MSMTLGNDQAICLRVSHYLLVSSPLVGHGAERQYVRVRVGNAAGIPRIDRSSSWTAGTSLDQPPGQEADMSLDPAKVASRCSPSRRGRPRPVLSLLGATSAGGPENGANRRSL
jgi:hypothetical protein